MNETIKTILSRRSIRKYQSEQLKDEELQTILEAAKFAPSGMNTQGWHFTVVQNPELLNRINTFVKETLLKSGNQAMAERAKAENFNVFYHAPTVIIVSGDQKALTPQFDCTLAMGNMFLAAESLGIGSCWIHAIHLALSSPEGKTLCSDLQIPSGFLPCASAAFGYKGMQASPAPRKDGTVTILK